MLSKDKEEPIDNLITWVFDEATFKPTAKIIDGEQFSIITDYLGTPVEMYNAQGEKTWAVEYDIYGKVRKIVEGSLEDCPFRYQGQYEDNETGLYYNRFRYYSPDSGTYISQDPIGLDGEMPNFYAYVWDSNSWVDVLGLKCAHVDSKGVLNLKNKFAKGSKESNELIDFVNKWNKEIAKNGNSMVRQSVSKSTRREASKAAKKHKLANPSKYSNGEVAGHISDVGWGGKIDGSFMPLSTSVNSYVGGATQAVSAGTKYIAVVLF